MGDRLAGRVVVVAGASAGMGLAASALCAAEGAEGAEVVMMARGKKRLEGREPRSTARSP